MRFIALTLALLIACGDKGDGTDTDVDPGDVSLCEAQDSSPTPVPESLFTDPYPDPEGGTLADGVYDLAEMRIYSPGTPDANIRNWRLVVEGDTLITLQPGSEEVPEIMGGTYHVDGTDLQVTLACPQSGSFSIPFTATQNEIWLFDPSEPNIKVYVRQ